MYRRAEYDQNIDNLDIILGSRFKQFVYQITFALRSVLSGLRAVFYIVFYIYIR